MAELSTGSIGFKLISLQGRDNYNFFQIPVKMSGNLKYYMTLICYCFTQFVGNPYDTLIEYRVTQPIIIQSLLPN